VEPVAVDACDGGLVAGAQGADVLDVQTALAAFGYGIAPTGMLNAETGFVVRAFQLHFRPQRVDGCLDRSTRLTLERVLAALPVI